MHVAETAGQQQVAQLGTDERVAAVVVLEVVEGHPVAPDVGRIRIEQERGIHHLGDARAQAPSTGTPRRSCVPRTAVRRHRPAAGCSGHCTMACAPDSRARWPAAFRSGPRRSRAARGSGAAGSRSAHRRRCPLPAGDAHRRSRSGRRCSIPAGAPGSAGAAVRCR
ncbi:hypothetical protein G6F68_015747 [Rhizopus microsporus]|nr:hypothetical protein G6F68_015747 [Rhizopus microsporus]